MLALMVCGSAAHNETNQTCGAVSMAAQQDVCRLIKHDSMSLPAQTRYYRHRSAAAGSGRTV
jgi:hypothetical protein